MLDAEPKLAPVESVNIPSYDEVLEFSGLSDVQFTFKMYKEYKERIQFRFKLINSQINFFEKEVSLFTNNNLNEAQNYQRDNCESILLKCVLLRNELMDQKDMFAVSDNASVLETKLEQLSQLLRDLKFSFAAFSTHGNFQSTGKSSSLVAELGPGQKVSSDLFAEYSRYDLDAKSAQNYFNSLIDNPKGYFSDSLLFGSGMAAVTTVMAALKDFKILSGSNLYFENQNIAQKFLDPNKTFFFEETNKDSIDETLSAEGGVEVAFIEPICNSFNMPTVDMDELSENGVNLRILVVDVTLFGIDFDFKTLISRFKKGTCFIFVNSLQKLFQEGDSVVPAGVVTVVSDNSEQVNEITNKLYGLRGMLGTNITQHSIQGLIRMEKETVLSYSKACSDNTKYVVNELSKALDSSVGKVVYSEIKEGSPPIFYINFNYDVGQDFVDQVLNYASAKGIQITDGASFGFRHTRLMCIGGDKKRLRICPGIENKREIVTLVQIFKQVLNEIEAEIH